MPRSLTLTDGKGLGFLTFSSFTSNRLSPPELLLSPEIVTNHPPPLHPELTSGFVLPMFESDNQFLSSQEQAPRTLLYPAFLAHCIASLWAITVLPLESQTREVGPLVRIS